MKTRDIVTGLIVLVILIAGVLLIRNARNKSLTNVPSPTPSIEQQVTQKFGNLTIPANADKADLTDVSGGQGMGEAARTFENGKFSLTVLADLPSPKAGYFYQGWIFNGTADISLGKLRIAKGGYLIDFTSTKDYSSYSKVVVTLEKVFDNTPETHILEGSF